MQEFIGWDGSLRKILGSIDNILRLKPFRMLVVGELGTGKSELARYIFAKTKEQNISIIEINCLTARDIPLEQPEQNVLLFFRHIEYLDPAVQKRLLSLLAAVDSPCVAASADKETIQKALRKGSFNETLYERLALIPLEIPPLRSRPEDLLGFLDIFLQQANKKYVREIEGISPEALAKLKAYAFPGNVSELKNIIQHAVLLEKTNVIQAANILLKTSAAESSKLDALELNLDKPFKAYKKAAVEQLEAVYLEHALRKQQGSVSRAAKEAKLLRPAFSRLLKKNKIKASDYK